MDTELFGLCKEVYKRTGWDDEKLGAFMKDVYPGENPMGIFETKEPLESKYIKTQCPLYTSDYLLEKLPKKIVKDSADYWFSLYPMDRQGSWGVGYSDESGPSNLDIYGVRSDTPLKALLKLVIALDNAKELPNGK